MTPLQICHHLGNDQVDAYYDELSGKEVRAVLKAGGVSSGVPKTAYTRSARLSAWRKRFFGEFSAGNSQLALALLIDWLMRHHREMLIDYLDFLGAKHTQGETDEDFCETNPPDKLREGADMLLAKYTPSHVATYLLLVGHLQETKVFDQTPSLLEALGMSAADAKKFVAEHIAEHGEAGAAKAAS